MKFYVEFHSETSVWTGTLTRRIWLKKRDMIFQSVTKKGGGVRDSEPAHIVCFMREIFILMNVLELISCTIKCNLPAF